MTSLHYKDAKNVALSFEEQEPFSEILLKLRKTWYYNLRLLIKHCTKHDHPDLEAEGLSCGLC